MNGRYIQASILAPREVAVEPIESAGGLLSVVRNVDICSVGIEYPLASGPATFTPDDLIEAVASQDDPAIRPPRVWLGHPDDQRFHAGRTSPVGSAEPAMGTVTNLRVEDNGMTLVGDIMGCPTWLANILASAYPNRSVEGAKDADTVTGHNWKLIITDLALLGVVWPGVSTLKDLQAVYSVEGPDGVEITEAEPMAIAAARALEAQINIDDVRRAFYSALGDMGISQWSWIRAMQLDPNELIVDDDEGGLYRIGFEISGEAVTFEDPQEVKIQYVNAGQKRDVNARTLLVNMLTRDARIAASWDQRAESRPEHNQEGSMNPELIRLLRAQTGLTEDQLPDNATEDQIMAALQAQHGNPSPPAVPPTTPPAEPGTNANPGGDDPGGGTPSPDQVPTGPGPGRMTAEPEPVAASALPPGMVAVPAEAWATMQSTVQTISAERVTQREAADIRAVHDAIREGKIFPSQREYFEARVKDPKTRDSYIHMLTASVDQGGLQRDTVPVTARGSDPTAFEQEAAYPGEWLPEVQDPAPNITIEA